MKSAQTQPASEIDAQWAAQAIVELINSRPTSPRRDEIADIIDKLAVAGPQPACCPHCTALDQEYGPATKP